MSSPARAAGTITYSGDGVGKITVDGTKLNFFSSADPAVDVDMAFDGYAPDAGGTLGKINIDDLAGLITTDVAAFAFAKDADVANYVPAEWLSALGQFTLTKNVPKTLNMEANYIVKNPTLPVVGNVRSGTATYGDGGNEFTPSLDITADNPRRSGGSHALT